MKLIIIKNCFSNCDKLHKIAMLRVVKKMLVLTGAREEDISFWSESEWR